MDLRDISSASLSIEIGGQTVPVTEKAQTSLGDPYTWTIRFVPPDKNPKDATTVYTPSLLYATEVLATVKDVTLSYPKP